MIAFTGKEKIGGEYETVDFDGVLVGTWSMNGMAQDAVLEIRRCRTLIMPMLIAAIMSVLAGIADILIGRYPFALMWFATSALWAINFAWSSKTPLARINSREVMIFTAMALSPKFVSWESVSMVQRVGKNLQLILHNDQRLKIHLFGFSNEEREAIICKVEHFSQGAAGPIGSSS